MHRSLFRVEINSHWRKMFSAVQFHIVLGQSLACWFSKQLGTVPGSFGQAQIFFLFFVTFYSMVCLIQLRLVKEIKLDARIELYWSYIDGIKLYWFHDNQPQIIRIVTMTRYSINVLLSKWIMNGKKYQINVHIVAWNFPVNSTYFWNFSCF